MTRITFLKILSLSICSLSTAIPAIFQLSGEVWSRAGLASAAAEEHGWRGCKVETHPQSVFLQLLIITRMFFKSTVLQSRKAIVRHDFLHP